MYLIEKNVITTKKKNEIYPQRFIATAQKI